MNYKELNEMKKTKFHVITIPSKINKSLNILTNRLTSNDIEIKSIQEYKNDLLDKVKKSIKLNCVCDNKKKSCDLNCSENCSSFTISCKSVFDIIDDMKNDEVNTNGMQNKY